MEPWRFDDLSNESDIDMSSYACDQAFNNQRENSLPRYDARDSPIYEGTTEENVSDTENILPWTDETSQDYSEMESDSEPETNIDEEITASNEKHMALGRLLPTHAIACKIGIY